MPTPVPTPVPVIQNLSLPDALELMPDTPVVRAAGVWYNNYALAARAYGLTSTLAITSPRIQDYFHAILPLRPGAETGVADLATGRWRLAYGYDLFQIAGDIYSRSGDSYICKGNVAGNYPLAVAIGRLDATAIDQALVAGNYLITHTVGGGAPLFVRRPVLLNVNARGAVMNALLPSQGRLVAGVRPCGVAKAAQAIDADAASLGRDGGYGALATAIEASGSVQAAYVAANVAPPPFALAPFPPPQEGHRGPSLHPFGLYAVAYQEPRPNERYVVLGLGYARHSDAQADGPTLRARLRRETLSIYGAPWGQLVSVATSTVRGNVLTLRLRLRPTTSPTLWQDVVAEHALSLLSK